MGRQAAGASIYRFLLLRVYSLWLEKNVRKHGTARTILKDRQ
jgi:hypothetical protein